MSKKRHEGLVHIEKSSAETERFSGAEQWQNPDVLSISMMRHGEWDAKDKRVPISSLTPDGAKRARKMAQAWRNEVMEMLGDRPAHFSFGESPSYIPDFSRMRDSGDGGKRPVTPMRAAQTASLFEQEVLGKKDWVKQHKGRAEKMDDGTLRAGQPFAFKRRRDELLGDRMESAEALQPGEEVKDLQKRVDENMAKFSKARKEAYKDATSPSEEFNNDFVYGELAPEVIEPLKAAGGSDSVDLAKRMALFLEGRGSDFARTKDDEENKNKEIEIDISHEETLRALLFHVASFVQERGVDIEPKGFASHIGFVEGFDVHLDGSGDIIIFRGDERVEFDLSAFNKYLESL